MMESVQLLDVSVNTASTKAAGDETIAYLEQESSKVVYFLSSETLLLLTDHADWKDTITESDMVLPGNGKVNGSIDEVLGHKRDPFFYESYFDRIFDYAVEMGMELLLVTESEEQFLSIQEDIHEKRPLLTFSGVYLTEQKESLEHIVNEINSVAPDILLVAMEQKQQLELLARYRQLMNAGLFLFTGDILYHKAMVDAQVPEQIEKLRISHVYRWFKTGGRIRTFFNNLRMKLRLKQRQKEQTEDEDIVNNS